MTARENVGGAEPRVARALRAGGAGSGALLAAGGGGGIEGSRFAGFGSLTAHDRAFKNGPCAGFNDE